MLICNCMDQTLAVFFLPCSCFISNKIAFFTAFLGPIILVLLFNTVTFVIVVRVMIKHTRKRIKNAETSEVQSATIKAIVSTFGIMATFGLTWLFGAFTILDGSTAFQFLFVISNSFQGFFIFLFYCVVSTEARMSLQMVLCIPCSKFAKWKTRHQGSSVPSSKTRVETGIVLTTRVATQSQSQPTYSSVGGEVYTNSNAA